MCIYSTYIWLIGIWLIWIWFIHIYIYMVNGWFVFGWFMLQHVAVLKCSAPPLQLANLLKFPMAFMAARVLTFEIALGHDETLHTTIGISTVRWIKAHIVKDKLENCACSGFHVKFTACRQSKWHQRRQRDQKSKPTWKAGWLARRGTKKACRPWIHSVWKSPWI